MELDTKLELEDITGTFNLAEKLTEDDLETIGHEVCEGYETDLQSRSGWEEKVEQWTEMALQVTSPKSHPWPGAANVKYPLITTAALQFSARAYPALLPGTNVVRGRVIGFDYDGSKLERAIRVGKHMSYQILEEMEDWEEEMDRLLFALPIVGCMFKKTYFSTIKGRNVSEIVYPRELVVNYWAKSLEEADRITHVLKLSENEVHERIVGGVFLDVDLERASCENDTGKVSDEVTGLQKPSEEDDTSPYTILEQHCFIDLDGDGYKEPYSVTVDLGSSRVLRIVPRYNEESITYSTTDKIVSIKPDNYFTKFSFVPSPDGGFYDIGFGILLGPINETINSLINQLLDAGTLSNMQAGFMSKGIRIKGGNKPMQPGEWRYANTVGDDLRKGLVPLPVREPSQVLFSLLGMMIESGEKLSSVTEVMTGEIPGQNTKATVAMAAIEQGMKVFSSIYKRIHRSLAKEYKKLFTLNSIYLEEEVYFNTLDIGQEQAAQVGLSDYAEGDVDIVPTSDPNVATEQQKIAKVQAMMELMQLGTINPQEVTKRYLEATEQANIEALMQMPEPQGPSIEEQELQLKQRELELKEKEVEAKEMLMEAQALKAIADAEGVEEGRQMDLYQKDLIGLEKMLDAEEKREQQQMQQQMKLMQQDQAHQQKMGQSEEMHQLKMMQANQRGSNSDTGSNSGGIQ